MVSQDLSKNIYYFCTETEKGGIEILVKAYF